MPLAEVPRHPNAEGTPSGPTTGLGISKVGFGGASSTGLGISNVTPQRTGGLWGLGGASSRTTGSRRASGCAPCGGGEATGAPHVTRPMAGANDPRRAVARAAVGGGLPVGATRALRRCGGGQRTHAAGTGREPGASAPHVAATPPPPVGPSVIQRRNTGCMPSLLLPEERCLRSLLGHWRAILLSRARALSSAVFLLEGVGGWGGRLWTACGQRCVDSRNSQTTPPTTSTSSIRKLLGAADVQTAHPATFSTAPAHQPLGSANAETTPARAPAAAADRKQRPDATCEGKSG